MNHPDFLRWWSDHIRPQPPPGSPPHQRHFPPPHSFFVRSFLMTKPENAAVSYYGTVLPAVVACEDYCHTRAMPPTRLAPENGKYLHIREPKMKMMRNTRILRLQTRFSTTSQTLGKIGKFSNQ